MRNAVVPKNLDREELWWPCGHLVENEWRCYRRLNQPLAITASSR